MTNLFDTFREITRDDMPDVGIDIFTQRPPQHEPFMSSVTVAGPAGVVPRHCRFCMAEVEHPSHLEATA